MLNYDLAILDPFKRVAIAKNFYLVIPVGDTEEAIKELIARSMRIEKATNKLLDGECSLWEFMEIIEQEDFDIDQYCDEVENNLSECLPQLIL